MAEEKADIQGGNAPSKEAKPTLFIILSVINMVVVGVVGFMLYMGKKKDAAEPTIDHVIKGEKAAQVQDVKDEMNFVREMIRLEPFVVNLAGSRGRRLARVTLELEVENPKVKDEIEARSAQVRDLIIIILSSKSYEAISSKEGKSSLRDEVRDTVNGFLTKGKIKKVYFTEFMYN